MIIFLAKKLYEVLFATYPKVKIFTPNSKCTHLFRECWFVDSLTSHFVSGSHILTVSQISKAFVFSIFTRLKIEDIKTELNSLDAFISTSLKRFFWKLDFNFILK